MVAAESTGAEEAGVRPAGAVEMARERSGLERRGARKVRLEEGRGRRWARGSGKGVSSMHRPLKDVCAGAEYPGKPGRLGDVGGETRERLKEDRGTQSPLGPSLPLARAIAFTRQ